ncbi:scopoletin glucosyltransferase-like [Iris pallida]|uniref:Scopoletin glucosyltransferase-like n=1 Tax=Iris pallida TaxID=29817 RepID=A0AAX6HDN3_IRIPA|nr:scopoletin glucosyltransferase-like [Iris pallida]
MVEYQYLRSPSSYDEPSPLDPLFEPPFGNPPVAPHDPDERMAAGFEAQSQLAELSRGEVAHAPETDVEDRTGALAVEPLQAVVAADGILVSPRGLISVCVAVAQCYGPYMPCPPPDHLPVVPRVVRLQLVEAVHHHAVALRLRLLHLIGELPFGLLEVGDLGHEQLDAMGEARDDQRLRLLREALERPVAAEAVPDAEGEQVHAVEDEPRYAELGRGVVSPREEHVRDDAVREEVSEDEVERLAEPPRGVDEGRHFCRRDGGQVLAAGGKAGVRREGDEEEPHRLGDRPVIGAVEERLDEVRVRRGGEDAGLDAAHGEELGHVEHREHVALGHEREEEHAETTPEAFRGHRYCNKLVPKQVLVGELWLFVVIKFLFNFSSSFL